MSNTTPETRTLLAEAAMAARELVPSLNSPEHWADFCDVDESGIEQYNLHLRDMQKRLIAVSFRLEEVAASGQGWACTLAREGLECARGAKVEVDGMLQACEVNPNRQIKRSRELFASFGDPDFPGAPLDPEVRKVYAFDAAARGAARLPLHGQLLDEWVASIDGILETTTINDARSESDQLASIILAMEGVSVPLEEYGVSGSTLDLSSWLTHTRAANDLHDFLNIEGDKYIYTLKTCKKKVSEACKSGVLISNGNLNSRELLIDPDSLQFFADKLFRKWDEKETEKQNRK